MIASLWADPTSVRSTSGLSAVRRKIGPGSLPYARASFGMQNAISATPATARTRSRITVTSTWCRLTVAKNPSSIKNSGP